MASNPITSFIPIFVIVLIGLPLIIAWIKVFGRIGWAPWLGVLMVIPVVNLVVFLVFGFKEWPIEVRLRGLKSGTHV